MDHTEELYKDIYKNSQMGMGSTSTVLAAYEGRALCDELSRESGEYSKIFAEAKKALGEKTHRLGLTPKEKFMTSYLIRLKLLRDAGDSKAAEMIIQGSNLGIIDAVRAKNTFNSADESSKALAQRLIDLQTNAIEKMKVFL